jgi:uncharacterized protein
VKRAVVSILLFLLAGCGETTPSSQLRTVRMPIGSRTYTLEVADTPATREHGLMKRDSMPTDHGMLFVFPDVDKRAFWMKHTRIPLEILYLDESGKIVHTASMKPYDLSRVPSYAPAKYAIELNAGQLTANGAKVGDVLPIPEDARETNE